MIKKAIEIKRQDLEETEEGFISSVFDSKENCLYVSFIKRGKDVNGSKVAKRVNCLTKFSFKK